MPNVVNFNWGTISGGAGNTTSGLFSTVAGGYHNSATKEGDAVGGGEYNAAGIGGASGCCDSTVAGGNSNQAFGEGTIGGGDNNYTYGGTVAGGSQNTAYAAGSIGGGIYNLVEGFYGMVPGGWGNSALGAESFAAGYGATANYDNSFVWSDGSGASGVSDTFPNQFVASAQSGFFFYTSGTLSTGATLPSGSGSWSSVSDRSVKDNFAAIDGDSLLTKIAALPISTWNYKTQATSIRHMGPTAQDFRSAFGLGEDEKHIANIDSEGVALAAIQALYKLNQEKDGKIAELSQALEQLKAEVEKLRDSSSKH